MAREEDETVPVPQRNGLHLAQPWELGNSYEQGDPGWYICSEPTGLIVLVIDDEIAITRSDAERILAALSREFAEAT